MSPKILEHFVMCFERRYLKQNSVICLKSNSSVPPNVVGSPQFFWLPALLRVESTVFEGWSSLLMKSKVNSVVFDASIIIRSVT